MTDRPPYGSVALVSALALAEEVLLMRMLSVVQWHHFAAMVISLALLGYGASGTLLSLLRGALMRHFPAAFTANLLLFAVASAVSFPLAQRLPFHPEDLFWGSGSYGALLAIYLLLALPFFFAANAVGLALVRFPRGTGRVYASDLAGAGLGAAAVVALLFLIFPGAALKALIAAALLTVLVGVFETRPLGLSSRWAVVPLLAALAAVPLLPGTWTAPQPSSYKALSQTLQVPGSRIVAERSSPLGLVTVVANDEVPLRHAPGLSLRAETGPPEQLGLFVDGEGPAAIGRAGAGSSRFLTHQTAALPYRIAQPRSVLVLGAGTGTEVRRALHFGATRVDAVELNAQVVGLLRGPLAEYSGNLYGRPGVTVHTRGIRNHMAHHPDGYDLIQVPPLGGGGDGLHAVAETYPYTVEAVGQYLERLRPGGILALTHPIRLPPRGVIKLFATAVEALERAGVAEPGRRLALVRGWQEATLLVRNGPFTPPELDRLRAFCKEQAFDPAHYPGIRPEDANRYNRLHSPAYFEAARALLGPERERFLADYKFHIRPATDQRPYFYRFFKWATLPEILETRGRGGTPLMESGYLTLVATLGQALVASVLFILLPLTLRRRSGLRDTGGLGGRTLVYFTAIGLAFLFVEIALLQRFLLFLGHPVYTAAVVLSGFLLFAGLGSALAGPLSRRYPPHLLVAAAAAAITLVVAVYGLVLGTVFDAAAGLNLPLKALLGVGLIAPLALAMGLPFPLALRRLGRNAPALVPWAWAVNGCASVLSAVLASLFFIHWGFTAVLGAAAALYLVAAMRFPEFAPNGGISRGSWPNISGIGEP